MGEAQEETTRPAASIPEINEEDTPVELDDSELVLPDALEAEVLGNQAYQMILQYSQLHINYRANKSVGGDKARLDSMSRDMQMMKNGIGFIYRKNPKAKNIVNRLKSADNAKAVSGKSME